MKSKRHYPALKTLEHLEHTYLPQVSHYRFCKIMVDNIPKLREEIKEVSMSDLKDFLESIRKHSDKIGETAMKQAQQQRNLDNIVSQHPRISGGKKSKKEVCASSDLEVPGAQDLVDFSPVYRCLHIYSVLKLCGDSSAQGLKANCSAKDGKHHFVSPSRADFI